MRSKAIADAQRALGWEPLVVTSPKHGAASGEERIDGVRYMRTGANVVGAAWRQLWALKRAVANLVARERVDVVHAHTPSLCGLASLWALRGAPTPVVYEVRGFYEDNAVAAGEYGASSLAYRARRASETAVLRGADAVVTISDGLHGDVVRRGVAQERVFVVPNGVNVDRFADPIPQPGLGASLGLSGCTVLAYIGNVKWPYEGLPLLIEALPRITAAVPGARLLLVGGTNPQMEAVIARMGCERWVVRAGRVPFEAIGAYYSLADICVYPRLRTRLTDLVTPLKPLEAMAAGVAVVASDVGGLRELVRNGDTGVLFPAEDSVALADRCIELAKNERMRQILGEHAKAFVRAEREWDDLSARYTEVYACARETCPRRWHWARAPFRSRPKPAARSATELEFTAVRGEM